MATFRNDTGDDLTIDRFGLYIPAGATFEIPDVDADSLAGRAEMSHVNLNDGVCEGLVVHGAPAFSVQHHPEAGPGPHDATYLFSEFTALMDAN